MADTKISAEADTEADNFRSLVVTVILAYVITLGDIQIITLTQKTFWMAC
jgi:hypothetical protein